MAPTLWFAFMWDSSRKDLFGTKKVFTKTTKVVTPDRRTSEATGIARNVWGVSLKPVPKKKIVMVKSVERASFDVNTIRLKPLNSLSLLGTLKNSKVNGFADSDHHPLTKATSDTVARVVKVKNLSLCSHNS